MRSRRRTSIHTVQRRHILREDNIDDASKMTLKSVEVQLATDFHVSLQMKEKQQQQQISQLHFQHVHVFGTIPRRNSSSAQQVYNVLDIGSTSTFSHLQSCSLMEVDGFF